MTVSIHYFNVRSEGGSNIPKCGNRWANEISGVVKNTKGIP